MTSRSRTKCLYLDSTHYTYVNIYKCKMCDSKKTLHSNFPHANLSDSLRTRTWKKYDCIISHERDIMPAVNWEKVFIFDSTTFSDLQFSLSALPSQNDPSMEKVHTNVQCTPTFSVRERYPTLMSVIFNLTMNEIYVIWTIRSRSANSDDFILSSVHKFSFPYIWNAAFDTLLGRNKQ